MISIDGLFRYELRREWDPRKPPFVCVMLNPSTADAYQNDPTIARLIRRASHADYGSLIVVNLGAYRAKDPAVWKAADDPIGPENRRNIRRVLAEAVERRGLVMVGWGNHAEGDLVEPVLKAARRARVKRLWCLGVTKHGHPKHPLHVAYNVPLTPYGVRL